ncbi:hypothetical protein SAMN05443665_103083 [Actinomadura meyerae]|uniref:Uncharacterized protein n=1 Tax=Actinomadura meyerae TaxID=240840 RepID=A0A239MS91_9ACTN|nr:hypothetical protein SAMN05443665_103083 [Actinomadura meyerae]
MIAAGDRETSRTPRDGEYAVRVNIRSNGGLTADRRTGEIYVPLAGDGGRQIAKIERDGRITMLAIGMAGAQLAVSGDRLWQLASYAGLQLSRTSLSSLERTEVLGSEQDRHPRFKLLDRSGKALPASETERLHEEWKGAQFTVRDDGVPILLSRSGRLFEVAGRDVLKRSEPPGYEAALRELGRTGDFQATDLTIDGARRLLVLGETGLLRVGSGGGVQVTRFPASARQAPPWTAAVPLSGGDVLLLGGVSPLQEKPRPALVTRHGELQMLSLGPLKDCEGFDGSMADVASADPGGVAEVPGGRFVMLNRFCGLVYSFRPPLNPSGVPYRR